MDVDLENKTSEELKSISQECWRIIEERNVNNAELEEKAKEEIRKAVQAYLDSPPIDKTFNIQIRVIHTPKDPLWIMGGAATELDTEIKADPEWQEWAEETIRYTHFDFYNGYIHDIRSNEYLRQFPEYKQAWILDDVREEYRNES